ncbi:MAG: hypothetical protein GX444_04140 [Myxococcales bacterium]|nr:hypothetical protein [Myxococcales bacterium]
MKSKKIHFILILALVTFYLFLLIACTDDHNNDPSGSCSITVEVEAEADSFVATADESADDCLPPKPEDVSEEDYQKAQKILERYAGLYENPADGTTLTMSCASSGFWMFPIHSDGNQLLCDSSWGIPVEVTSANGEIYLCGLDQSNPDYLQFNASMRCTIDGEFELVAYHELSNGGFEWMFLDLNLVWRKID